MLERLRGILHEGDVDKRVQFLIEGLFALLKAAKFQIVRPELDLVEQLTHQVSLLDEIDGDSDIDVFQPDPQFVENERMYEDLKKQILPGDEDEDDEDQTADSVWIAMRKRKRSR